MLILGIRKTFVFRKQWIVVYYLQISKNRVSAKFLHTLYTIKLVYIKFLVLIKNCVSAKSVLKESVYNKALLYDTFCQIPKLKEIHFKSRDLCTHKTSR